MCGEIDIMEHVGHDAGRVHGTIHTEMCNTRKEPRLETYCQSTWGSGTPTGWRGHMIASTSSTTDIGT